MSAGVQQEVLPRVSVNVAYFRSRVRQFPHDAEPGRIAGRLRPVLHRSAIGSEATWRRRSADLRLMMCPWPSDPVIDNYLAARNNSGTCSSAGMAPTWPSMARLQNGILLQGGISIGKAVTDNCDVRFEDRHSINVALASLLIPIGNAPPQVGNPSTRSVNSTTPFLSNVKLLGSYALRGHPTLWHVPEHSGAPNHGDIHGDERPDSNRRLAATCRVDRPAPPRSSWFNRGPCTAIACTRSISVWPRT